MLGSFLNTIQMLKSANIRAHFVFQNNSPRFVRRIISRLFFALANHPSKKRLRRFFIMKLKHIFPVDPFSTITWFRLEVFLRCSLIWIEASSIPTINWWSRIKYISFSSKCSGVFCKSETFQIVFEDSNLIPSECFTLF